MVNIEERIGESLCICEEEEPSKFMQDVFSDMSYEELERKWTCLECGEVCEDEDGEPSARVQAGMKCGECAYG